MYAYNAYQLYHSIPQYSDKSIEYALQNPSQSIPIENRKPLPLIRKSIRVICIIFLQNPIKPIAPNQLNIAQSKQEPALKG